MVKKSKFFRKPLRTNLSRLSLSISVLLFALIGGFYMLYKSSASTPILPSQISFNDNFDNRRTDGWAQVDDGKTQPGRATWQVMSHGVLQNHGNIWGGSKDYQAIEKPGTYFHAGNTGWKNYSFNMRMKTDDDDAMGVMFRYTDDNNYYRFSIDREIGYRRLVEKRNGRYTTLWEEYFQGANRSPRKKSGYAYEKDRWYSLSIKLRGSSISIQMIDEATRKEVLAMKPITSSSLPSGRIALYTWGMHSAFFDDVTVTADIAAGFTLAVLPDTQFYSENDPAVFSAQTQWIAKQRGETKIPFVLHEGDIVEDMCRQDEWSRAIESMSYLNGKVPYAFAPGNHDIIGYKTGCATNPRTIDSKKLNSFLSFKDQRIHNSSTLKGTLAKSNGQDMSTSYHTFTVGGIRFLVLSLPFGPSDSELAWAKSIAKQHPAHYGILLTHDLLDADGSLRGSLPRCTTPGPADGCHFALPSIAGQNNGKQIWEKLVQDPNVNIRMVLNGHVVTKNQTKTGAVSRRSIKVSKQRTVHAMLANYQSMTEKGYLRLIKFDPASKMIQVSTYSPTLNKNLTDSANNFTLGWNL